MRLLLQRMHAGGYAGGYALSARKPRARAWPSLPTAAPTCLPFRPCIPGVCDDPDYFYDYIDGLYAGLGWSGAGARDTLAAQQARGEGYAISTDPELATVQVRGVYGRQRAARLGAQVVRCSGRLV